MVILFQIAALLAALGLANGDVPKTPSVGPVSYDVFLPSGG